MKAPPRFALREARSDQERKAHYRLRYEVYVEEMHSVRPGELSGSDRKARLERDWYDRYAVPFLFVDTKTNKYVGAVRLIPDTPRGFLMEERFPLPADIDRKKTVELSRFLICRAFRDRSSGFDRHDIAIALYQWCRRHNITTWCAAMQAWLLYAFLKDGIAFELLGPVVRRYHHTAVVPSLLRDLDAGVRYMYLLNHPLHLRYTKGRELPPLPGDRGSEVAQRVARDRVMLRGKLKWLYPVETLRWWLRMVRSRQK